MINSLPADALLASAGREYAESHARFGVDVLRWAQATRAEAAGDAAGRDDLVQAWEQPVPRSAIERLRVGPDVVRLARISGRHGLATSVVESVESAAHTNPSESWRATSPVGIGSWRRRRC